MLSDLLPSVREQFLHVLSRRTRAAFALWNRRAMRTGLRMPEEGADALCRFGRQDVFELAGLFFDLGLIHHPEALGEQHFGQAVATYHVGCALAAAVREFHHRRPIRW